MNDQHLKEPATNTNLDISPQNPLKGFFFFLLPFFLFLPLSFTKTCLSCLRPSLCPTSPFLLPLQKAGAWALALNSDPACNQSYPWALPSSQATDSSSLLPPPFPTSSSCSSLCPCVFFFLFFFLLSLLLDPEWSCWLLKGCCSETTKIEQPLRPNNRPKPPLVSHSPGPRPYPSVCEMTLNWWVNDGVNLSRQDGLSLELI